MKNYQKVFKAYDIRGIFEEDIDPMFCFILGYAMGEDTIKKNGEDASVFVSSDTRQVNKELIAYFIRGLTQAGIKHIDTCTPSADAAYPYGIISTSAAYYIVQKNWDMTAIFTASHNPAEYVGMKCFDREASLTSTDHLRTIFSQAQTVRNDRPIPTETKQYTSKPKVLEERIQSYYTMIGENRQKLQKNHKFVVDFCHGAAVSFEKIFYETYATNHLITMTNDYPDGTFPAHGAETCDPENYRQLIQEIQKQGAEFGVMFDGDADRLGFVTNTGQVIPGDIIYAIIVKQLLQNNTDNPICIYDCMSSKVAAETISANGGIPQIYKVGRYFINKAMGEKNAIAGGEVSGHYMFRDIGCIESVLLAQYYVMKESENYNDMDTMIAQYQKYYKGPVQSISVDNKEGVMKKIQDHFHDKKIITIDGVSVYEDSYRCNIRPSNTENKIRFTVEADDEHVRSQKVTELRDIIQSN